MPPVPNWAVKRPLCGIDPIEGVEASLPRAGARRRARSRSWWAISTKWRGARSLLIAFSGHLLPALGMSALRDKRTCPGRGHSRLDRTDLYHTNAWPNGRSGPRTWSSSSETLIAGQATPKRKPPQTASRSVRRTAKSAHPLLPATINQDTRQSAGSASSSQPVPSEKWRTS
jgi:hypothetical protein